MLNCEILALECQSMGEDADYEDLQSMAVSHIPVFLFTISFCSQDKYNQHDVQLGSWQQKLYAIPFSLIHAQFDTRGRKPSGKS